MNFLYFNSIKPTKTNNNTYGINTNNHAKAGTPPRQIMFNTQVQNSTYMIFNKNTIETLDTLQLYEPRQYTFVPPTFWKLITMIAAIEMTK